MLPKASTRLQRQFLATFFDTVWVSIDGPAEPQPKESTTILLDSIATVTTNTNNVTRVVDGEIEQPTFHVTGAKTLEPGSEDPGSRMSLVVPRTGFEPVLPA